jgi:hypothetical protein
MIQIYRKSFAYFFVSLPVLIGYAALIEGLLWLLEPRAEATVTAPALFIIAYFFHRHFLFGETLSLGKPNQVPGTPGLNPGWFLAISFLLMILPVGIAVPVALNVSTEHGQGILIMIVFPLYLAVLSLFGTALPASVSREGTYRLSEGLRATFQTMWRLILGPGLVGLAVVAGVVLADQALARLTLAEDSLAMLVWFVAVRTLGFLSTIHAVAVLCEMYRRTRPTSGTGLADQRPA